MYKYYFARTSDHIPTDVFKLGLILSFIYNKTLQINYYTVIMLPFSAVILL